MRKKSPSTLIYFQEKARKKNLLKKPPRVDKVKRAKNLVLVTRLAAIFVLTSFLIWFYVKYRPLDIKAIEISGAERFVSKGDVRKIVEDRALGRNVILFDNKSLEVVITNNFLASKTVTVKKSLPTLLKIQITERIPIALVLPRDSEDFYFVDAEGFILGVVDKSDTNLPVINYNQKVEIGKFIEAGAVSYYFNLIKALDADSILVSTISSHPHYTEFYTNDSTHVLFTNAQNPKPQVKVFAKMLEAFKTEGKVVRKIDLRFDKVIVEFIN